MPDRESIMGRESNTKEDRAAIARGAAATPAEASAEKAAEAGASRDFAPVSEEQAQDDVYEAGLESFPASDPPSWNLGR